MDAETAEKIFEPYFTTKRTGTGLGLATVYGIAQQAGGRIDVRSVLGRGTSFKLNFPRTEDEVEAAEAAVQEASGSGGSETVLIVEDESQVRRMAADALRQRGYGVLEAAEGGAALERCRDHPGPIHLLLTDMVMPGLSGVQVAQQALRLRPAMRVLYMSGYMEQAPEGLVPNKNFLQKPVGAKMLVRRVRELLDEGVA